MNDPIPRINAGYENLLIFVLVVLGLSWLQFIPPSLDTIMGIESPAAVGSALGIVFLFSPLVAALILINRIETDRVQPFLKNRFRWRVHFIWYITAFLLFPLLIGSAFVLFVLLGGSVPSMGTTEFLFVVEAFTLGIIANLFENYGWRGYLQEGLQSTTSALVASLSVGIVWGLWHAPLFLVEGGPLADIAYSWYLVMIVGVAIIFGWVYNETGGSVLIVTLMHCTFNAAISPLLFALIEADTNASLFLALTALVIWISAGVLLLWVSYESLTLQ